MIGQAGTPGKCANKDPVHLHVDRADRRRRAELAGRARPRHRRPERGDRGRAASGSSTTRTGWAFGPELWATDDGGNTWIQVNTTGARVTDLETSGGRAYALFATCSTPSGGASSGFAADCTSYTLMTATAGSDDWTPVGAATTGLADGGAATSAVLELTGTNGYLLAPDGTLYSGPIGGTWSQVGTSICKPGPAQANGLPERRAARAGQPDRAVDRLQRDIGQRSAGDVHVRQRRRVLDPTAGRLAGPTSPASATSASRRRWRRRRTARSRWPPPPGSTTCRPAASGWKPSNATGTGAPKGGFSYVGMTTDDQGVAVPADTSLHEIWMTADGGDTWAPATSITPGN